MLIINDAQHRCAGVASLGEPCPYCSQPLHAYPLIMSDDAKPSVYHAACALQLATEILVDLYTFFRPPAPYDRLFVLVDSQAAIPASGRADGRTER